MAPPIITFHDDLGAEITTPLALPTATPGTPTAPLAISTRNNDAAGPAVDPARNLRLTILGRLASSGAEPSADHAFVVQRALEIKVVSVTGGTAQVTAFRPLGASATLALGQLDDGGIVNLEVRTNATLLASLTAMELFLSAESIQSTALEDGSYEANGNWIYTGQPGGLPDPNFSSLFSEAGAWIVSGLPDGTVNTPTETIYTLAGVPESWEPAPATVVYNDEDGAAATLLATEAYYVGVALTVGGAISETKGLKAVEPLTDLDKPVLPEGDLLRLWVIVPFGLEITALEFIDIQGFFDLSVVTGLTVRVAAGQAAVGGRWVDDQTSTDLVLADDSDLTLYRQPESGLEVVDFGTPPTDARSMRLYELTTAAGAVTVIDDHRRIGILSRGGLLQFADFVIDAAVPPNQTVHVTLLDGVRDPLKRSVVIHCFLSEDAEGLLEATNIPDTVTAPSPQAVTEISDLRHLFLSSDMESLDVTFNEASGPSGHTYHLVILGSGEILGTTGRIVSGPITPKP